MNVPRYSYYAETAAKKSEQKGTYKFRREVLWPEAKLTAPFEYPTGSFTSVSCLFWYTGLDEIF